MKQEEFIKLNEIRVLMDENLPKAKQKLTMLLKQYYDFIHWEDD